MAMWRLKPQIKRAITRWEPLNYPRILGLFIRKPLQIHSLVVMLMFMVAMMLWTQRKKATATLGPPESCTSASTPLAAATLFDSMEQLSSYEQAFMSGVLIWIRQQELAMASPAEHADHGRSYYLGWKRPRAAGSAQVVHNVLNQDQAASPEHTAEYCVFADVLVRAYHRGELSYLGLTQLDHLDYFRPSQAVYLVEADQVHLYEACSLHRIRYRAQ